MTMVSTILSSLARPTHPAEMLSSVRRKRKEFQEVGKPRRVWRTRRITRIALCARPRHKWRCLCRLICLVRARSPPLIITSFKMKKAVIVP